jgi:lysophospholipase L1-like esterase
MIYKNALLHNVAELVADKGNEGLRIQRVPESVRVKLEEPARARTQNPDGCEIRFVLQGSEAAITVRAAEVGTTARLFFGPFDARQAWVIGSEPTTIRVSVPPDQRERMAVLSPRRLASFPFAPAVCRLVFHQRGIVLLQDIQGDIRPPTPAELPGKTILGYGTSITHGAAATQHHLTWLAQTAWRLGADAVNLGVGGACRSEPVFGDFIAERTDWNVAILSLSVNMIGAGFSIAEFRERTGYLIRRVAEAHPDKPVVCVSIYPYFGDFEPGLQPTAKATPNEFREALRAVVEELGHDNLHYVDGPSILSDLSGLTADMIHPSDLGMITMGENMARRVAPLLRGA